MESRLIWRPGYVDEDERRRFCEFCDGVPGVFAAQRRQGPGRPAVSRSAALFFGSQHYMAGLAGALWPLEQRLEALRPA
jgi:transposase